MRYQHGRPSLGDRSSDFGQQTSNNSKKSVRSLLSRPSLGSKLLVILLENNNNKNITMPPRPSNLLDVFQKAADQMRQRRPELTHNQKVRSRCDDGMAWWLVAGCVGTNIVESSWCNPVLIFIERLESVLVILLVLDENRFSG